jgi:TolB protein
MPSNHNHYYPSLDRKLATQYMVVPRLVFNFSILLLGLCTLCAFAALAVSPVLPVGSWLAFSSQRDGGDWDIFISDMQRNLVVQWTPDDRLLASDEFYPAWSPDGEYLLFRSSRDSNYDLYTMAIGSMAMHNLTTDPSTQDGDAVWSPDGSQIAYSALAQVGSTEIYLLDAASGQSTQLTHNDFYDGLPTWSPDGTQLAYTSVGSGSQLELFRMEVALGEASRVNLTQQPYNEYAPTWSADGRFIVFFTDRDINYELYVMNADGSDQHRLTHHPADDSYPRWLADGSGILFTSTRTGNEDVYLLPMHDGEAVGEPRNLTNNPAIDRFAAMRP